MRFGIRDLVLEEIVRLAEKHNLDILMLFGSRARGDYKKTSDIDLAASGGNIAAFTIDLEETSTLLMFDVVDLGSNVVPQLLESINNQGVILYEKS